MSFTHHDLAQRIQPGAKPNRSGNYKVRCINHNDDKPSLGISAGASGQPVVNCLAGCDQPTVWRKCLEIMGGDKPTLAPARHTQAPQYVSILPAPCEPKESDYEHYEFGQPTLVYRYCNASGNVNFYNCRFEFVEGTPLYEKYGRKTHRPLTYMRKCSGRLCEWRWGAPEVGKCTPYRIHLLTTDTAMIHEGEKAADAAAILEPEICHLAWWGGAPNWNRTDWSPLAGMTVWLIPDADKPTDDNPQGASVKAMDQLKQHLESLGCTVHYARGVHAAMQRAGLAWEDYKGFDAADAVTLGWTHEQWVAYVSNAEKDEPLPGAQIDLAAALRDELAEAKEANKPFCALGYNNDVYYYLSKQTRQIHELAPASHKDLNLLSICDSEDYWIDYAPNQAHDGVNWKRAAGRMMAECKRAGLFFPEYSRGRGAWFDSGNTVLHLGDRLIVNGEESDILTRPGRYVYEMGKPLDGPGNVKMTDAEGQEIFSLAHEFAWEHPIFATYLVGWAVLAPICGALYWRPHTWITGPAGSGKTTVQERFVKKLLGPDMALIIQGSTTEAGIRQLLKNDALPVLFDESESEDDRGRNRISMIMQLMRQSSSETEAKTVKGGSGGRAQSYHIRSMFALSSIGVDLKQQADKSRVTVLSLKKHINEWGALQSRLARLDDGVSKRLIARTVGLIPVIRENARVLGVEVAKITGSQRLGDQYGTLLAGRIALTSSHRLTEAEAVEFVTPLTRELAFQAGEIELDEDQCLAHLSQQVLRVDVSSGSPVTMSVGELIHIVSRGHDGRVQAAAADAALKRHGIIVKPPHSLIIARTHSKLADLFRGTSWAGGWHRYMLRLPGARVPLTPGGSEAKYRYNGSSPIRGIELPLELLEGGDDQPEPADEVGF